MALAQSPDHIEIPVSFSLYPPLKSGGKFKIASPMHHNHIVTAMEMHLDIAAVFRDAVN